MERPPPAGTIAPAMSGTSLWSRVMWVPLDGRIRGTSASSWSSSGRMRSAQTPVALTTLSAWIVNSSPEWTSLRHDARRLPVLLLQLLDLDAVGHDRAEALGLAEDGEDEAAVVGLAVVEEVAGGGVAVRERGDELLDLVAVDRAVAVGAPLRGLRLGLAASSRPAGAELVDAHDVVEVQAGADGAVGALVVEGGDDERERVDEVRRELDHELALEEGFSHEAEVEVLEVSEAAVDELARAAARAGCVVGLLDEGDGVAAGGGVEGDARARDAAADDDDVELLGLEGVEGVLSRDHRRGGA